MQNKRAAFIHDDTIPYHYPPDCPFKTERASRTKEILVSINSYTGSRRKEIAPVAATEDELLLYHTSDYLDTLKRVSGGDFRSEDLFAGLGTDDTPVFGDLYAYAALACGGTITGARLILENKADIAFNPSGGYHHALADKAGGFCYINDVVLGCMTLAHTGKKVLCLDLDAHHGNGTQRAFFSRNDVFTISFHESGETLYPWGGHENELGEEEGAGYNCNMPFPSGTDDDTYFAAFQELVAPLVAAYNPDIIVLEIGMDILSVDPLTHLSMTNNVTADILQEVLTWNKPLLAIGGGGYSPEDTARGWARAWCVLCGIELEQDQYMGLGGVFLGSAEWSAGLRDKHIYLSGEEKEKVSAKVERSIDIIKKTIFPIHNL